MKSAVLGSVAVVLLLIFGTLSFLAFHYHGTAVKQEGTISQLQSDNTLQASTISLQSLTFNTFNQIAAAAQQYAVRADSTSEGKTIEYRTILKKEAVPVCSQLVPASVSDGLYNYAHRLRSSAVSGTVGDADGPGSATTTTSTLTYCQAVLWIDPLLTAIDKANNQLAQIREEDAKRTGTASK